MPPKARITKEMIVSAAFDIARNEGADNINARSVAEKLGCSTQPVLYHFSTVDEIRNEVYRKADEFHTEYLTTFRSEEPMMDMGLNYIRFGAEEKNLFRLLFQSNGFSGKNISKLVCSEELLPVLGILSQTAEVSIEQAGTIFMTLLMFVHGYASMLANNDMEYDEKSASKDLERVFNGAVYASKEEEK